MYIRIIPSFIAFILIFGVFGQNNPVIDSLENILKIAKADTTKVNNLRSICKEYWKISDYENAMRYAESALLLAKALDYKKGIAKSYTTVGYTYEIQINYPEAMENYFSALNTYKEIGDKKGIAWCYHSFGYIYREQGNFPEALENYFVALKTYEEIEDKKNIAFAYFDIGLVYDLQSNYTKALENYFAALKIYKEIGDKSGIAGCYQHIGNIYSNLGNYPEALDKYLASLKISEEVGNRYSFAHAYTSIGIIYYHQGNYKEALENLFAALKIHKELVNRRDIALIYTNIGTIYAEQGKYQEALEKSFAGLKIYKEIREKINIPSSYISIGTVYKELGNYPEALKNYFASLKISKEIGNRQNIAYSHLNIGGIYSEQRNYPDARKHLDDCLALSKEIGNKLLIKEVYYSLSKLDSAEGNFAQALEHYKKFTLYKDSLRIEENKTQIDGLLIQYETEKKDREIELLNKDKALQEQQLEKQTLIRDGMIAGAILMLLVGLLLFRSFRLRKKLEKKQVIMQERKRISSDLHDDVGSGLSRIMLLSELMKKEAKTPKSRKEVEKIATISHELSSNINEIVWALNSNNDYVENLVAYIRRYASEYFENSSIKLIINKPVNLDHTPISGEHRRNIFFAVKEALHNIVKHAMATEARLKFTVKHNMLSIVINDNGKGFNKEELNKFGNGLKNMRSRMKNINGNCIIENQNGARITLTSPV